MNHQLTNNMTGSAFLAFTRNLAVYEREGSKLTGTEREQVNLSVEIYGPEMFYMDGELFA